MVYTHLLGKSQKVPVHVNGWKVVIKHHMQVLIVKVQ